MNNFDLNQTTIIVIVLIIISGLFLIQRVGTVKVCLLLSYLGQAAWLISVINNGGYSGEGILNPFYAMVPTFMLVPMIIIATMAAIIASQSLITGSYTLILEAIKLDMFPRLKIEYPFSCKGQMYISAIKFIL